MGDKVGFMLMPGKDAATRRSSLGGESLPWAITSKSKNPDVAAAYIDFLTDANAAKVLVETDNLPAMKGAPAPTGGLSVGRLRRLAEAQRRRRPDPVPGLRDADVLRRHLRRRSRSCWPASRTPDAFTKGVQEDYDKWCEPDDAAWHAGRSRRPASRAASRYLYLLPAFAVFALFVLAPLRAQRRGSRCSHWDGADGRARGPGSSNYTAVVSGPGAALARSCTR